MSDLDLKYRFRREMARLFRDVTGDDELWFVEACLTEQPDAVIAYVRIKKTADDRIILVDWVQTEKEYRRQGIATRLLNMARERWPNVELSPAFTPEGEAFLASLRNE